MSSLLPVIISVLLSLLLPQVAVARTVYPWQQTMTGTCWTDPACNRSLVVSHGGDWNLDAPYDSMLAFERAFEKGADCVKGDFRVAQDDVGVVAHSSPILYYESPQCMGKRIENMTSTQVTECHLTVTSQTYITVPHLLQWAQGRSIVMLCVKEPRDIARAITTIIENNATDRTFLELRLGNLQSVINLPFFDQVYYLAECNSANDISLVLALPPTLRARVFAVEFEPVTCCGDSVAVTRNLLHPAGLKALGVSGKFMPDQKSQEQLFTQYAMDIDYTYGLANAVAARTVVNKQRGVVPS